MSMVGPRREAVRIIRKLCRYEYQAPSSSEFQGRLRRNVRGEGRRSTKADAWNATLIAILTTQQPSGPESRPAQVLRSGVLTWHKVKTPDRSTCAGLLSGPDGCCVVKIAIRVAFHASAFVDRRPSPRTFRRNLPWNSELEGAC